MERTHPFREQLPEAIRSKLNRARTPNEEVLVQVATDLTADGQFGQQWLVMTDQKLTVIPADGGKTAQVPISEVTGVRIEDWVGAGRMEVDRRGGRPLSLSFTQSLRPKFAEVAEGIRQLTRGEPLALPTELEKKRCPECGRLLPEGTALCAFCRKSRETLKRLIGYMFSFKKRFVLMVLLTVTTTALGLMPPKITQHVIDDVLTPRANVDLLVHLVLLLLSVRAVIWVNQVATEWLSRWLGHRSIQDMRVELFRHFQFLPLRFYDKRKIGALISRMSTDTDRLEEYFIIGVPFVFSNTLMAAGILSLLSIMNWELTLFVLIPIPFVIFAGTTIWSRMLRLFQRWSNKWARLHAHLNESITGIRVVKAFSQEVREGERFNRRNEDLCQVDINVERNWFVFFSLSNFLMSFGAFSVWYFGGRQILKEELTLGALIAFISYLWMLYEPLQWLGALYNFTLGAFAGARRVFEVIDSDPEPFDAPDAIQIPGIEGRITFKNVAFGYDPGKPVLKGIDLDVAPGEMIGVVGKTGAGKTTLINLVCRLYDPNRGAIEVDGVDMRKIELKCLRSQIGVVHQEPFLFDATIAENIAYGVPGAAFEEILQAAIAAEAHEFIIRKPEGYDTIVGEGGKMLAGGERQRIAIARAILYDPRILILDEAMSSVDTPTEKKIQSAISRLVRGRTTFAIAHRLSTLRSADRLVVLDEGKVAEVGTHAQLLNRKGIFYRFVETQKETSAVIQVGKVA